MQQQMIPTCMSPSLAAVVGYLAKPIIHSFVANGLQYLQEEEHHLCLVDLTVIEVLQQRPQPSVRPSVRVAQDLGGMGGLFCYSPCGVSAASGVHATQEVVIGLYEYNHSGLGVGMGTLCSKLLLLCSTKLHIMLIIGSKYATGLIIGGISVACSPSCTSSDSPADSIVLTLSAIPMTPLGPLLPLVAGPRPLGPLLPLVAGPRPLGPLLPLVAGPRPLGPLLPLVAGPRPLGPLLPLVAGPRPLGPLAELRPLSMTTSLSAHVRVHCNI